VEESEERAQGYEVVATLLGLTAFLLLLLSVLVLSFVAMGHGYLEAAGWVLLVVPAVLAVALVVTARRIVHR
jgi:hypothetical protein